MDNQAVRDYADILEIRRLLFKATKESLQIDGHCKSCEANITTGYPHYFESDGDADKHPDIDYIQVYSYLLCPGGRRESWSGKGCVQKALQEVREWVKSHDSWYAEEIRDAN